MGPRRRKLGTRQAQNPRPKLASTLNAAGHPRVTRYRRAGGTQEQPVGHGWRKRGPAIQRLRRNTNSPPSQGWPRRSSGGAWRWSLRRTWRSPTRRKTRTARRSRTAARLMTPAPRVRFLLTPTASSHCLASPRSHCRPSHLPAPHQTSPISSHSPPGFWVASASQVVRAALTLDCEGWQWRGGSQSGITL